jgi:hypothetical protein
MKRHPCSVDRKHVLASRYRSKHSAADKQGSLRQRVAPSCSGNSAPHPGQANSALFCMTQQARDLRVVLWVESSFDELDQDVNDLDVQLL